MTRSSRTAGAVKEGSTSGLTREELSSDAPVKPGPTAPVSAVPADWWVWPALTAVRLVATAVLPVISDCDQTFNYEEPTHAVMYARGLQTWEYAPQYALRSYAYVGAHGLLASAVGGAWGVDKIAVFHRVHYALAAICAAAEAYFVGGVAVTQGRGPALLTAALLASAAGMAHAAPAYLPSTFTMVALTFAWGAWLRGRTSAALAAAVIGLGLGWPFAVVALVPWAVHLLATRRFLALVGWGLAWSALVIATCLLVDHCFYRRWLFAPWNIVLYNALGVGGGGQGSDLYGVEPPTFYLANLFLNFNVQLALALAAPAVVVAANALAPWRDAVAATSPHLHSSSAAPTTAWVCMAQWLLWLGFMSARPHKEERFMFVVFPLISHAAATALWTVAAGLGHWVGPQLASGPPRPGATVVTVTPAALLRWSLALTVVAASACVSALRVASLADGFRAPVQAWTAVARHYAGGPAVPDVVLGMEPHSGSLSSRAFAHRPLGSVDPVATTDVTGPLLCVGKEWYRFPSHFFLPDATHRPEWATARGPARLGFLKSAFGGQLPQPFNATIGTSGWAPGFNDVNAEETDRYVADWRTCDAIVDFRLPLAPDQQDSHLEPWWAALDACLCDGSTEDQPVRYASLWSAPFLHADSTPSLARALMVPPSARVYGTYHVLQRQDAAAACAYHACSTDRHA